MTDQTPQPAHVRMHGLMAEHHAALANGEHLEHGKATELDALLSQVGGMMRPGRIPATDVEHAAVDRLLAKNPGKPAAMSRRDPGNSGPLLVVIGDDAYVIDSAGRSRKQAV